MDQLKSMKEQLTSIVQGQLGDISKVDTKELGEAVDMIKDLAEAIYYCSITDAMEESDKKEIKNNTYYYTMPQEYANGRMYYGGNQSGVNSNQDGKNMYMPNYRTNPVYYTPDIREYEYMPEYMTPHDPREGRARQSRRMYMESKEMHKDVSTQMKDLEKYLKDLSQDITEIVMDATPEEKQVLQQKIATLANKIM